MAVHMLKHAVCRSDICRVSIMLCMKFWIVLSFSGFPMIEHRCVWISKCLSEKLDHPINTSCLNSMNNLWCRSLLKIACLCWDKILIQNSQLLLRGFFSGFKYQMLFLEYNHLLELVLKMAEFPVVLSKHYFSCKTIFPSALFVGSIEMWHFMWNDLSCIKWGLVIVCHVDIFHFLTEKRGTIPCI